MTTWEKWRAERPRREKALLAALTVRHAEGSSPDDKTAANATILAYENADDLPGDRSEEAKP